MPVTSRMATLIIGRLFTLSVRRHLPRDLLRETHHHTPRQTRYEGTVAPVKNIYHFLCPLQMDSTCVPCPLTHSSFGPTHLVAPYTDLTQHHLVIRDTNWQNVDVSTHQPADRCARPSASVSEKHFEWARYKIAIPEATQSLEEFEVLIDDVRMLISAISWASHGQYLVQNPHYQVGSVTFNVLVPSLPPSMWPHLRHHCTTYLERVTVINRFILIVSPQDVGWVWDTEERRVAGRREAVCTHSASIDDNWWDMHVLVSPTNRSKIILVADVDDTSVYIHECLRDAETPLSPLWPDSFRSHIAHFVNSD